MKLAEDWGDMLVPSGRSSHTYRIMQIHLKLLEDMQLSNMKGIKKALL